MSHSYRAYGWDLVSSVPLHGLRPSDAAIAEPDLSLQTGPEPDWAARGLALPGRVVSHRPGLEDVAEPAFVLTEHGRAECFELSYSDGTRFVVDAASKRVWGTYREPLTLADFETYFLGPVMGFLLRKRQVTALHASCVKIAGHAIAISGDAGQGKSTTAAALALRGYPVLCEDITATEERGEEIRAIPGYPRVCLWPDSVEMLLGAPDALPALTPVWEKRYLPLDGQRASFWPEKLTLGGVYLFAARAAGEAAPRIEPLRPREALLLLVQNTYMNWLLTKEQRAAEFDALARLVRRVPIRRLVPHADPKRLGDLCELLARDAEQVTTPRAKP